LLGNETPGELGKVELVGDEIALEVPVKLASEEGHHIACLEVRVFVSYSHDDWRYCHKDLMVRIQIRANRRKVELWCDRKISPGDEWNDVIKEKVDGADIFAFLVTTNFLSSNYIRTKEAGRAWERHRNGEAKIIPILLETCSGQGEGLGRVAPSSNAQWSPQTDPRMGKQPACKRLATG